MLSWADPLDRNLIDFIGPPRYPVWPGHFIVDCDVRLMWAYASDRRIFQGTWKQEMAQCMAVFPISVSGAGVGKLVPHDNLTPTGFSMPLSRTEPSNLAGRRRVRFMNRWGVSQTPPVVCHGPPPQPEKLAYWRSVANRPVPKLLEQLARGAFDYTTSCIGFFTVDHLQAFLKVREHDCGKMDIWGTHYRREGEWTSKWLTRNDFPPFRPGTFAPHRPGGNLGVLDAISHALRNVF